MAGFKWGGRANRKWKGVGLRCPVGREDAQGSGMGKSEGSD